MNHQQPPTSPLAERSPNTASTSPTKHTAKDNKMMADLRASDLQKQTYVSPSDNILSPTTKKLSEIKGKRFNSGKPQSLFAKTVSRQGMKSEEKLNEMLKGGEKKE